MPALPSPLYLVTDRRQTQGRELVQVVEPALQGGVRAVQLREKDLSSRELYRLAVQLRALTSRYQALLLVNDRIDIALAVEADGVHLGGHSLPPAVARRLIGPHKLIGVSTHSLAEARAAQAEGADFLLFGPVFFTPSKARYGKPVGIEALQEVHRAISIPLYAIGGIKVHNVGSIAATGVEGFAVISAVMAAPDPEQAAQDLLATFAQAQPSASSQEK
ncbi:MAG: thiamine phosphate synthase [Nitrospinota bacterium]|nr:MAG: thiamine phosphate synthase [Nitrospinota bacterium]